jgi:CubicO group peptidase (beta-lactamase class C family)
VVRLLIVAWNAKVNVIKPLPHLLLLLLVTLLLPFKMVNSAQPAVTGIDFNALDQVVEAQMAKHGLPGVSLAVIQGSEIVHLKGYGTAGGRPMTPQTRMLIGSQSKSFTALLIAQLAEQGLINLNAPVQTYIPWFQVDDENATSRITVNHLLHHTSGLSEAGHSVLLPDDATLEEAVRSLSKARLTAPVGTQFQYFNLGYTVLACIIELISGQNYADYLAAQVFEPLGMSRSTASPATATDLSRGYSRLFGFVFPMRQPVRDFAIGAGYIVSTAEDMARYAIAMKDRDTQLLTSEMYDRMFTPGLGDYGMGWSVYRDGTKIYHGGANETFATEVNLYPREDRAFVLLVNQGHLLDHYVSVTQLEGSIEAFMFGNPPPPVSQGWSVQWFGWILGVLVIALLLMHTRNIIQLKTWPARARQMSPGKRAWDVTISFLIPTAILAVILSQMSGFFGYRFNLLTTLAQFRFSLPDIFILMLVGTIPDYFQGVYKLVKFPRSG